MFVRCYDIYYSFRLWGNLYMNKIRFFVLVFYNLVIEIKDVKINKVIYG